MFRTLIYPTSGACDYSVELPHWSYCSWFDVCWRFGVVGLEWYLCCNTDTTPTHPHRNSNTHRTKNNTTNVVIQQNSRKLLMMDILMSETYWAHKKWNEIASDIKLVFYSSKITLILLFVITIIVYVTYLSELWSQQRESRRGKLLINPEPKLLEAEVLVSSSSISLSVRNVWLLLWDLWIVNLGIGF